MIDRLRSENQRRVIFSPYDLDAEVVFDRWIGRADELDLFQSILAAHTAAWCTKLRVWKSVRDQRPVDISRRGALKEAVLAASYERGPTYQALVHRYGKPPFERLSGSAELRGSNRDLTVVISVDEMVLSPLGETRCLGNGITVQVRGTRACDDAGGEWVAKLFSDLCENLSPAWGCAGTVAEYWAKVMTEGPSIAAVGRDFGRYLPGLFWLNFFGRRLSDHIGKNHLLATPAQIVRGVDAGVLLGVSSEPGGWQSPEYQAEEARVRQHLGADLFFDRKQPSGRITMPPWDS